MRSTDRRLSSVLGSAAAAAALLAFQAGSPPAGAAQTREPRERALWVSVVDEKGAPVGDLRPDEFVIREDGRRREALRVEKATEPIDLTLLVDTSQAMSPHMAFARPALKELVTTLGPHASIALVTFGDRPTIAVERTRTLTALTRGVDRLHATEGSGAYLVDAVWETLNGIRKREPARAVIAAVVTDGVEFTTLNADMVLARLAETGARFDVFNVSETVSTDLPDDPARERARLISGGTARSGGQRVDMVTNMALQSHITQYATELLNQYRVIYVRPETLIPPERIDVAVSRPGLAVRATPVPIPRG